jgi:hypothetical protein
LSELGEEYNKYLLELLREPVTETQQFELGSEAIRENLARTSAGARQRLGETAIAGGYGDSGAVLDASGDIDRAELQAFAAGLRDLLMGLEERRAAQVLPYLGLGVQENLGVEGVNIEAILAMKELSRKKLQDTSSELRGWYDTTGGPRVASVVVLRSAWSAARRAICPVQWTWVAAIQISANATR